MRRHRLQRRPLRPGACRQENRSSQYNIIYDAIDDIRSAMEGLLTPELKKSKSVRSKFAKLQSPEGRLHGGMVIKGKVKRNSYVKVIRDSIRSPQLLKISSLKRFKDDAREVVEGFECSIGLEHFHIYESAISSTSTNTRKSPETGA